MVSYISKVVALAAVVAPFTVSAVTPILVAGGCSNFPGYNNETSTSGGNVVWAVNTIAPVSGNGLTYKTSNGVAEYVVVVNNQEAKGPFRCTGRTASDTVIQSLFGGSWSPAKVSGSSLSAKLTNGLPGADLQAYWHDTPNEGHIYLGSNGATEWAIKKDPTSNYWTLRLLPNLCDVAGLQAGEERTYLALY